MQTLDKHRFIGLEWLRFLMGFYVVVYHTIHFYPERKTIPLLDEITSMGFFATSTFFVLSGFLLAHVYCGRGSLREPARSFWVKRFANLYPIHIFALLLAMAVVTWIGSLGIPPGAATASIRFVVFDTNEPLARTNPELFQHFMTNAELAFNAVLQLFMLQAWNPYYLTFNAPLWSISALFFFYLTFPKLAPRLMTSERPWQLLLLVWVLYLIPPLLVILHQNYGMPFTGLLQRVPLFRLPEFLAGILLYAIFRRQHARGWIPSERQRLLLASYLILSFALGTALFTHGPKFWYFLFHNGLFLPSQLILVYLAALAQEPASERIRHWSPRLGGASLSMFALHVPLSGIYMTLEQLIGGNLKACLSGDREVCIAAAGAYTNSIEWYWLFLLAVVVICVLFQERLVVPTRKRILAVLLPRLAPPQQPPRASGGSLRP
ncbi:acyltransferase [Pseudomonas oryzihabitans]|uniref:acyltransferase family protein n=1 Tax=Pseudomonas oryzihabitans TaxID=47885 RepID=UPI0018D670C5|nr:acyltransferase [Pseudomonas oryzihabitans]